MAVAEQALHEDVHLREGERVIVTTPFGSVIVAHHESRVRVTVYNKVAKHGDADYGMVSSPDFMFPPQNMLSIDLQKKSEDLMIVKWDDFHRNRQRYVQP